MSSRRTQETHPGASGTPYHDPYQRWIPPVQHESSRSRHRTTTSQPINDARLGAGRQVDQSRPHTSTRGYQTDSTYVNSSVPHHDSSSQNQPSTSRNHRSGHVQYAHKSGTQQPQSQKSFSQAPQAQPLQYPQNTQTIHHQQRAPLDVYDPKRHLHRNTAAASSPQSSVEKVSSTEDIARSTRHAPPRNSHDSRTPASSTPATWIPPSQEGPSSRRQRHKETEREAEEHANKAREKSERRKEKEKQTLEKERAKEKERSKEKRRANEQLVQERRGTVKPPSSTRYYEPRVDDPDSSDSAMKRHAPVSISRRGHRVEDGTPSLSTVCRSSLL
jgi:hypothetical protein